MPTQLLFVNACQVVTCAGPPRARRGDELPTPASSPTPPSPSTTARSSPSARRMNSSARYPAAARVDCERGVLTPGLVDSHTHGIFGKPRFEEQELRAAGIGYMEIARRGGGIHSSVRDLRARSEDELFALALPRLRGSPRTARPPSSSRAATASRSTTS